MATITTAWDLIGFDGRDGHVRIAGGRALYESVDFNDNTRGGKVRLARLETRPGMKLHQVNRWVDPDTPMEIVGGES